MQPWPPCAITASAVASSPESWMNSGPMAWRCRLMRSILAVASLTPAMFFSSNSRAIVSTRHVDHRARRDVVDDDRDADGVVDRLVMLVEPFLAGLVVVGRHDQQAVRARLFGEAGELDRLGGVVGAGAGDHRHPAAGDLDAHLDHPLVLVVAERRAFAGGADRHQPVACPRSICQSTKPRNASSSKRAVAHRRHQRSNRSSEHGTYFRRPNSRQTRRVKSTRRP